MSEAGPSGEWDAPSQPGLLRAEVLTLAPVLSQDQLGAASLLAPSQASGARAAWRWRDRFARICGMLLARGEAPPPDRDQWPLHGKPPPEFMRYQSLIVLSPTNRLRRACAWLVTWRWFEPIVLATVLLNCVCLALNDPTLPSPMYSADPVFNSVLWGAEWLFLSVYLLEMCLKVVAMGFILHRGAYLRDVWNVIDAVLISASLVAQERARTPPQQRAHQHRSRTERRQPSCGTAHAPASATASHRACLPARPQLADLPAFSALRAIRLLLALRNATRFKGMVTVCQVLIGSAPRLSSGALLDS